MMTSNEHRDELLASVGGLHVGECHASYSDHSLDKEGLDCKPCVGIPTQTTLENSPEEASAKNIPRIYQKHLVPPAVNETSTYLLW